MEEKELKNIQIEEGVADGLELLISHYRYGTDGESSTVLCDISDRIVAFFNRGTEKYNIIKCEGVWKGKDFLSLSGDFIEPLQKKELIGNVEINHLGGKDYFNNIIKEYGN